MPGSTIPERLENLEDKKQLWGADKIEIFLSGDAVKVTFKPEQHDGLSDRIRAALKAVVEAEVNR